MVTLALVDPEYEIRRFKRVNDRFGHLAGDRLLRSVARCIEAQIRASDVSARYGGEEFILLLPNTPLDSGRRLAERVRRAVSAIPFDVGPDEPLAVTVSIGAAEHRAWPQRFDSTRAAERLIARADCALYEAKAEGRNRVAEASLAP
jgi:diguanylate cyclase (GGDEF)-like protein